MMTDMTFFPYRRRLKRSAPGGSPGAKTPS